MNYLVATPMGKLQGLAPEAVQMHFDTVVANPIMSVVFVIVHFIIVTLILRNNLQKGIEKLAKILLPLLIILMFVLIVFGITREGARRG